MPPTDEMQVPDYAEPIREFRVWRVSFEVDEQQLYNAVTLQMLGFGEDRGFVPRLEMTRPDPVLRSWNMGLPWAVGWNHAVCLKHAHPAPVFDCRCGHYGVSDLGMVFNGGARVDYQRLPFEGPSGIRADVAVPGVVELRGRAIEHDRGHRAEYARPVAILNASRWSPWLEHTGPLFELIGELYGVAVTSFPGMLEDIRTRHIDIDPALEPNPNARLLLGGPLDGTMVNVNGTPAELLVSAFHVLRPDDDEDNGLAMPRAVYARLGGNTYRFKEMTT